jgi:hypothetical protein
MAQWLRNVFSGRGEASRRGPGGWQILMGKDIRLLVPPGLPKDTKWEAWGRIQTRLLFLIHQHWPDSHIYIRFNAFPAGYFGDKFQDCTFETITADKRDEIFLFPDCQNTRVMETIFAVLGMVPFTRCLYILDRQPANWQEVTEHLFEATKKMAKKRPVIEYNNELSECRFLCYSVSEDLVIGKIDMSQSDITSILENVAREERIELSIKLR